MEPTTQSTFETQLALLGYDAPDSYDFDPCTHPQAESCTLFIQQDAGCYERDSVRIFRDLKWIFYQGCRTCCDLTESLVMCGGLYQNVRLFVAGIDATATSQLHSAEIPHARTPLPKEDEDEETDEASESPR